MLKHIHATGWRNLTMLAVCLSLCGTAVAQAPAEPAGTDTATVVPSTPTAVVTDTVERVLAVLRDKSLNEQSAKRQIRGIVGENFDFTAMANRVLATNWRKATKAQRARFTSLFRELLTNTYWRKISGYTNERVEYQTERMRSDTLATVNTTVHTDTVTIPVDYKLYYKDGRWLAYDVVIEQVSLVRNYRSSFQDIVHESGIDGLIGQLQVKVAESSEEADQP